MNYTRKYANNRDAFLDCCEYLTATVSKEAKLEVLTAMNNLINASRTISASTEIQKEIIERAARNNALADEMVEHFNANGLAAITIEGNV